MSWVVSFCSSLAFSLDHITPTYRPPDSLISPVVLMILPCPSTEEGLVRLFSRSGVYGDYTAYILASFFFMAWNL